MRSNNRRLIPFIIALVIALLACGPGAPASTPDIHELETNVAFTLTALSPGEAGIDSTPPPVAIPSDTPVVPTVPAPPTLTSTASEIPVPCDKATFVSETIPDGSDLAPSTAFTKTWRVRNAGTCTWNTSYAIVFYDGDSLSAPAAVAFPSVVAPGQEVDLSLNMVAPAGVGSYVSNWKFRNASGVIFVNNPFFAKIDVVAATAIPLSAYTNQVGNQVSIAAGNQGNSSVACPGGSVVTGGGFATGGGSMFVKTQNQTGNSWSVYAVNQYANTQTLNTNAICLYNSGGTTSQILEQVTVPANDNGNVVAACPPGSVVTGGGYASDANFIVYNSSKNGNGWQVYARNNNASGKPLNAYASCLAGTSATVSREFTTKNITGGTADGVQATCPSGSILTGGGFDTNTNLMVYNSSMALGDSETWSVYAQNYSLGPLQLISYAICLTFP